MKSLMSAYAKRSINLLGGLYAHLLSLKKKNHKTSALSVLVLPPSDAGSLGDQAMVTAVMNHFQQKGFKVDLLAYVSISKCKNFYPEAEVFEYKNPIQFARLVSQYDKFFCLGADIMDGYYGQRHSIFRAKLTSLAAKTGATSGILGFSFNNNPKPAAVRSLENLPQNAKLFARDPVSHKRLQQHLKRPVELAADLAFLLPPDNTSEVSSEVLQWTQTEKAEGRIVIGINANCQLLAKLEVSTSENLCKFYIDNLVKLYDVRSVSFVIIPHDFRKEEGKISDIAFAEMIWSSLPSEIQFHCLKVPTPCTAADIKAICGELDVVLTGRMHLAIASLGQGTPAACITYQGKFEGLFQHFELNEMTITPEKAIQPESIFNFLIPIIENRTELRNHIDAKLPYIHKMAATNLS